MTNKEEFIKLHEAFQNIHEAEKKLNNLKIFIDESYFLDSFYCAHDLCLTHILNEEGLELFYNMLFADQTVDDMLIELEDYFT